MIPLWSLVTLGTEVCVTIAVFSIIAYAYRTGRFMSIFAFAVLAYELVFNVSYMASREVHAAARPEALNPYLTGLAIFHGVFSLLMFIALIAFFIAAWRTYRAGTNFFLVHKKLTITFVSAWSISILSGLVLFAELYLF